MEFIITNNKLYKKESKWSLKGKTFSLEIHLLNEKLGSKNLNFENEKSLIIGETNSSFKKSIGNNPTQQLILKNISKLSNGFVVFYNKLSKEITIWSDVLGFYHLFLVQNENDILITSDYKEALKVSKKIYDNFAMLDMVLFNYTLLDRTLCSDIKRILGGAKIVLTEDTFDLSYPNSFVNDFIKNRTKESLDTKSFANLLSNSIREELYDDLPIQLTMSGGFDSRALLAACNYLQKDVDTFTFGQEGNIENEMIIPFIKDFTEDHRFLNLDEEYVQQIPDLYHSFINKNLDNPVFHSLIEFEYSNRKISNSNIVAGFMGGEMMIGQSVGAQVTFTQSAADLLFSRSISEAKGKILKRIEDIDFLNSHEIEPLLNSYLKSLEKYLYKEDYTNVIRFLINEKFSKFFGAVNKVFGQNNNLITPFMNPTFLEQVLKSNISFLRGKPLSKNPLGSIRSKIFYARSIRFLSPGLAKTKFDRLYTVNDLCRWYTLPKVAYYYIIVHLFRKSNKMYTPTTRYDLWYDDLIVKYLSQGSQYDIDIFKKDISKKAEELNGMNLFEKRNLMKLMSIYASLEHSI